VRGDGFVSLGPLALYTLFHLNLAYSSIEEAQRPAVIRRCYWPLLQLIEAGIPLALELTGFTLETIARLDPAWVAKLRSLLAAGRCQLIGSGRSQLIGPLVPVAVNRANLRLGLADYERHLGLRPRIALINEQAYSAGLVPLYCEAGFEAIIMEWDNPASSHPQWERSWRYLPQRALGADGGSIPLIWSHSVAFQRFQRYAHGELELAELVAYLQGHVGSGRRLFSLYANDAEVFDLRPGRYATEPEPMAAGEEWRRIGQLLMQLQADPQIHLVLPQAGLALLTEPQAGHPLALEGADQPLPVKKQHKYNATRWAVSGRDDLLINTLCHRLAQVLPQRQAGEGEWRELCDLWASDFRTHITPTRWRTYREWLGQVCQRYGLSADPLPALPFPPPTARLPAGVTVAVVGRFLEITSQRLRLRLNCRRGLAIEGVWLDGEGPLVVTLPHGHFDTIALGADWYSGHLVYEAPGAAKVTDLVALSPLWGESEGALAVVASLDLPIGRLHKRLLIEPAQPVVELEYRLEPTQRCWGSLRLGHLTLNPHCFSADTLWFATHNGGEVLERFVPGGRPFDLGRAVSQRVSAGGCLGMTAGVVEVGDRQHVIRIESDPASVALVALPQLLVEEGNYLFRMIFSACEMDETRPREGALNPIVARLRLTFSRIE